MTERGGVREWERKFKCCCNKCRQAVSLKTVIETFINGEVTKNGVRNSLGAGSHRVTQDSTTNYSNRLNGNVCSSRLSHPLSLIKWRLPVRVYQKLCMCMYARACVFVCACAWRWRWRWRWRSFASVLCGVPQSYCVYQFCWWCHCLYVYVYVMCRRSLLFCVGMCVCVRVLSTSTVLPFAIFFFQLIVRLLLDDVTDVCLICLICVNLIVACPAHSHTYIHTYIQRPFSRLGCESTCQCPLARTRVCVTAGILSAHFCK